MGKPTQAFTFRGLTMALLENISDSIYDESDVPLHQLGDMWIDQYSRRYIYSLATAAITQYKVIDAAAAVGVDAVANGATELRWNGKKYGTTNQIYKTSAGWTVGAYDGYLGIVDDGTGEGNAFLIEHNTADTLFVTWNNGDSGVTLAVADSDVEFWHPDKVLTSVANTHGPTAGVAPIAVTDAYYFWRQVRGPCFVLITAAALGAGIHIVRDDAATTAGTFRSTANADDMDDATLYGTSTSLTSATTAARGSYVILNLQ